MVKLMLVVANMRLACTTQRLAHSNYIVTVN